MALEGERHAELLNRTVSVGTDSDGRRHVRIELDVRHAELVLRKLGLRRSYEVQGVVL